MALVGVALSTALGCAGAPSEGAPLGLEGRADNASARATRIDTISALLGGPEREEVRHLLVGRVKGTPQPCYGTITTFKGPFARIEIALRTVP
jgi:hypothetical protein